MDPEQLRQKREAEEQSKEHDTQKVSHYAKLGGTFVAGGIKRAKDSRGATPSNSSRSLMHSSSLKLGSTSSDGTSPRIGSPSPRGGNASPHAADSGWASEAVPQAAIIEERESQLIAEASPSAKPKSPPSTAPIIEERKSQVAEEMAAARKAAAAAAPVVVKEEPRKSLSGTSSSAKPKTTPAVTSPSSAAKEVKEERLSVISAESAPAQKPELLGNFLAKRRASKVEVKGNASTEKTKSPAPAPAPAAAAPVTPAEKRKSWVTVETTTAEKPKENIVSSGLVKDRLSKLDPNDRPKTPSKPPAPAPAPEQPKSKPVEQPKGKPEQPKSKAAAAAEKLEKLRQAAAAANAK